MGESELIPLFSINDGLMMYYSPVVGLKGIAGIGCTKNYQCYFLSQSTVDEYEKTFNGRDIPWQD